ncbi:probable phosphinothricin acetyltransferase [Psychrobacter arcticus 273-4]|uniref:Probable phosphinothricin acetyltransferase n=1 Tax=Psychrobacter arcticus (strain DSM 17307 / VKM B-2377 / 273-4) TaxID=259536 RepID=Q4FQV0_PSYA2|nr:GNAT family N-acetyltransferase [Psychrobacter arcticus]AAZ19608.1 probable phosphinothricin acetyltransferase [Psychrobacter arcticus 273-4]
MSAITANPNSKPVFDRTNLPTLTNKFGDKFIVQFAVASDLVEVLAIYNKSIAGKQATANLEPVTYEERAVWFAEHINSATRPIYVVRMANMAMESEMEKQLSSIIAWGSFSDLYARPAYHISSEISIYIHNDYHGQGLGSLLVRWMLHQAPSLGIYNVAALIFAHNQPSLGLFRKLGFEQWGLMPQVCDMDGFIADVVMLGKRLATEDVTDDIRNG